MVGMFFFNDTATTEIYTLSLHDALPICSTCSARSGLPSFGGGMTSSGSRLVRDRKSTRLNSSHSQISYAVFCLKKKIDIIARHIGRDTNISRTSMRLIELHNSALRPTSL